ncbi:MAG: hypothetical protein ABI761_06195 [Saprospiraceae bacterium]
MSIPCPQIISFNCVRLHAILIRAIHSIKRFPHLYRWIVLPGFLLFFQYSQAQSVTSYPMIPLNGDTVLFMSDQLPTGIKYWPFNSDSMKWDLNGVKAPYIRRSILINDEPSPALFNFSNAVVQINPTSREFLKISPDTILSYGINGVDLFNDGKYYTGFYTSPRIFHNKTFATSKVPLKSNYKLVYDCGLSQLPRNMLNQLPYSPDSIRVVTLIEEELAFKSSVVLDLNLQRYLTTVENKITIQSTRLETRKSNLDWQDVTRFVKFPKLFKSDTIRTSSFYKDSTGAPVAVLYYKNVRELDKIVYKAPETFKDLIIVEDFKPNLFFFPNPYTYGALRCELSIKNPGLYSARIVNLIGNEIWRQNYYLESSQTIDLDFSFLNKGTYFFVLEQDKNHVIATKRLLVIKA